MTLYLVRHAAAIDRTAAVPDADRYLTPEGRRFFRKTVKRMAEMGARPDRILSSPLVRAVQTAEILAEKTGFRGLLTVTEKLSPGFGRADLRGVLADCAGAEGVALVGHEPDLGDLVASLLSLRDPCRLKKGSVIALRLPGGGALSPAAFLWSAAGKEVVTEEAELGERRPPGKGSRLVAKKRA